MSEELGKFKGKVVSNVGVEYFDADKGSIKRIMIAFTDGASLILGASIESQGNPHDTATYIAALNWAKLGSKPLPGMEDELTPHIQMPSMEDELTPHIQTDIFLKGGGSQY